MLIKIVIVLVVVVAAFLIVASQQPADFTVKRSALLSAPPATVFSKVNDLHAWEAWSPWAKMDPNTKSTYEGPVSGPGASMAWSGNMKVGEGKMTIIESRSNELVRLKLDFLKPMTATNMAEFTFKPQGTQTLVTWSMSGHNNLIAKAMGLVMNFDKMVGGQFDQGLTNLKSIVETVR